MDTYNVIRDAVLNKKQITCYYNGHNRFLCPHTLGTKNGVQQCLCYQFAGTSESGKMGWKCITVSKMQSVSSREGEWHTNPSQHSQSQTCVDNVDVEVDY